MIRWFFKYGIVIFLFNTVLLSIEVTKNLGDIIFLIIMALHFTLLLLNPGVIKRIIFHKAFSFFLILNCLNLFYFLLFHSFNDLKALEYLLARGVQFSIISISIYSHFEYYKTKFFDHLVYVISFIVILSLFIDINLFSARYSGIVWNPNMLASFTTIAFSILFLKAKQKKRYELILLLLFLVVALSTGSRGVLISLALLMLFKYGFSYRNLSYVLLALLAGFIITNFQLDTSLNRFATQGLLNNRLLQYQFAIESIANKMYIGYGLDKYSYIDKDLIPWFYKGGVIGAHNGYLAILTQYGVIFGSMVIFIIFRKSIQVVNWFKESIGVERVYLFIIIYALVSSLYESLMTGINEFHTILFWFSIAFLSFLKFNQEYGD